jgi:hypothetical protein
LEEWISNTGGLERLSNELRTNDIALEQVAKSIAVLHHDEDIKAYLRTKDYATNKIMSDGCEDWIKTFQEQGIQEHFHSQVEN